MSRDTPSRRGISARTLLLGGGGLIALVLLFVVFSANRTPSSASQPATVPHFVDTAQQDHHGVTGGRQVVIARPDEALPGLSGETGPLMATLVSGEYPSSGTVAVVRTDENCAADGDGVSHCRNALEVGGTQLVVQHHHKMALTPCLTPGETVEIITVAAYEAQG